MRSQHGWMVRGPGLVAGVILLLQAPTLRAESGRDAAGEGRPGRVAAVSAADPGADAVLGDGQLLALVTPSQGNELDGETVEFRLRVSTSLDRSTLEVSLNGSRIESKFRESACTSTYCDETAEVTGEDGLQNGKNGLTATAYGAGGVGDSEHVRFDWYPGAHTRALRSHPPTLPFYTLRPAGYGGLPWIQIGTETFPVPSMQPCGDYTMQVLVLDRYQLTEKAYRCFTNAATLRDYLQQRTTGDLVIAGTSTVVTHAFPGLNTTAIGGTDFSNAGQFPANRYPQYYMVVGVGGAPAGQAYESFSVLRTKDQFAHYLPVSNGMLSEDSSAAYNFHASARPLFQVLPGAHSSTIQIGEKTYTSGSGTDGFWVMLIDRVLLQQNGGSPCEDGDPKFPCSRFFATGSADATAAAKAIADMAAYLTGNTSPRNLLFLTSVGTPLSSRARPSEALFRAMDALGGSGYVLMELANTPLKNQTYSLVSAPDVGYQTSLGGRAAFSSSLLTRQGQTGRLRGLLAQNHFALFSPLEFAQDTAAGDRNGNHVDFTFEQIAMQQPGPWPYSGSPGHVAAYRLLSWRMLHSYLQDPTGDHLHDIRFYYTGSQNRTIAGGAKDPTDFAYEAQCACTPQEWKDTAEQLSKEKKYLGQLINFFGNATEGSHLGGVIAGSGSSVTLNMLKAANDVRNGALQPDPNVRFSLGLTGVLGLATGVVQIGQLFSGPYAIPAGLVGGVLSIAGTLAGGLQPGGIPNPEFAFTTTLAQLNSNTTRYLDNMQTAFNTSMDSIYSDWSKMEAAGRKVADTTGTGWYYRTQVSLGVDLREMMVLAMQREAYVQLMRPYYGVDYWPNIAYSSYDRIGSQYVQPGVYPGCKAFYKDNRTPSEAAFTFPSPGGRDILVIAGEIKNNERYTVTEKNVPVPLVRLLFDNSRTDEPPGMSFPKETFLGPSGPLSRRTGARYGVNLCTP